MVGYFGNICGNKFHWSVIQVLPTKQCTNFFSWCVDFTLQRSSVKNVKVKLLKNVTLYGNSDKPSDYKALISSDTKTS